MDGIGKDGNILQIELFLSVCEKWVLSKTGILVDD
jgi:hypothetical protein